MHERVGTWHHMPGGGSHSHLCPGQVPSRMPMSAGDHGDHAKTTTLDCFLPYDAQEEYKTEGLNVQEIRFRNNEGIIDLISKTPFGLMVVLEDQVCCPVVSKTTLRRPTRCRRMWRAPLFGMLRAFTAMSRSSTWVALARWPCGPLLTVVFFPRLPRL